MEIIVSNAAGKMDVVIMSLHGDLDGSNYQEVIEKGREVQASGAKYILIDMEDVPFMGSAGLVALHSIALLMRGEEPLNSEDGWAALHTISSDAAAGQQQFVKILNPQPSVDRSLAKTGMKEFFEVYTDLEAAVASC